MILVDGALIFSIISCIYSTKSYNIPYVPLPVDMNITWKLGARETVVVDFSRLVFTKAAFVIMIVDLWWLFSPSGLLVNGCPIESPGGVLKLFNGLKHPRRIPLALLDVGSGSYFLKAQVLLLYGWPWIYWCSVLGDMGASGFGLRISKVSEWRCRIKRGAFSSFHSNPWK